MKIFTMSAVVVAMLMAWATPSFSQSVIDEFRAEHQSTRYATVKGWTVYALNHSYDGFLGCGAAKTERAGQLLLEYNNRRWNIIVPTDQTGRFGGAIFSVDKHDFDSQFGFDLGFATKEITRTELSFIKSGSSLGVEINGDRARYWSLSGSTAAILKVQECSANQGVRRKAKRRTTTRRPAKRSRNVPNSSGSKTAMATCDTPTSATYRCVVKSLPSEAGYIETYQVDPASGGGTSYFFKVKNKNAADVWIAFDSGPWKYVGEWVNSGQNGQCSAPGRNLDAEARDNLGQDAWELCVR